MFLNAYFENCPTSWRGSNNDLKTVVLVNHKYYDGLSPDFASLAYRRSLIAVNIWAPMAHMDDNINFRRSAMKLNVLLAGTAFMTVSLVAAGAQAAVFPSYGADTNGPGLTLTLGGGNTVTITSSGQGPYDSSDDTYVGVINNSGSSVNSLFLKSKSQPIFGFDSDGINTYGAPGNGTDTTGYGGPNAYFTGISPDFMSGTVHFINPILNGGTDYFSLEEALDQASFSNGGGISVSGVPEPATWAMFLVGFGAIGYVLRRQRKLLGVAA
jgi:hypothetical protein